MNQLENSEIYDESSCEFSLQSSPVVEISVSFVWQLKYDRKIFAIPVGPENFAASTCDTQL